MDPLTAIRIEPGRIDDPGISTVLQAHHSLMRSQSPAESCHVFEPEALSEANAVLFVAMSNDDVLGVGTLVSIGDREGEIKSMHTLSRARGRGVGRAILQQLLDEAKRRGMDRVSLETGSQPEFAAARSLYEKLGFSVCPPFGSYRVDPLSVFMTRDISTAAGHRPR